MNLFEFLYKKLPNKFEYVFLDDGDEITPALFAYLNHIKPTVKEFFIILNQGEELMQENQHLQDEVNRLTSEVIKSQEAKES